MLIDLWSLLSQEGKEMELQADFSMDEIDTGVSNVTVCDKHPVSFKFTHTGNKHVTVEADIDITISSPCDRCLAPERCRQCNGSGCPDSGADGRRCSAGHCRPVLRLHPEWKDRTTAARHGPSKRR